MVINTLPNSIRVYYLKDPVKGPCVSQQCILWNRGNMYRVMSKSNMDTAKTEPDVAFRSLERTECMSE